MQEQLNQVRKQFEEMLNITNSKPNDKWKGLSAVCYLFNILDFPEKAQKVSNGLPLSQADKIFFNEIKKMTKEYEDKFYEIAKPFIIDYWRITNEIISSFNALKILEKFNLCEEFIKEEEVNQEHNEETKKAQIKVIKGFAYYINKELEDKMDSKCRAKYYEILKM